MKEDIKIKILREARRILSDKSRWTRQFLARDMFGNRTVPGSTNAHSFCMLGAVEQAKYNLGVQASGANSPLYQVIGNQLIGEFNDNSTTTHKDVLRVFDTAIEKLEKANDQ